MTTNPTNGSSGSGKATQEPARKPNKGFWTTERKWLASIWGGLTLVVAVNAYVVLIANDNLPSLVTQNYYADGLAYGEKAQLLQKGRELGYETELQGNEVVLKQNGIALAWPAGNVQLQQPHDATADVHKDLQAGASLVLPRSGRWNLWFMSSDGSFGVEGSFQVR